MTSEPDLLELDLGAAAAALESGRLDAVALTEAYLDRIAVTEPELNAYVTVDADGARAAARAAAAEIAAGHYRGPLHGVPVGVKDLFDTAGLRTTYGSIRYARHVPTADAVVVARLRSAGAVILGKQATHEFAWGGRTDNPHFGPTHNPHDHSRIPGGSSGGSAASVVARSCLVAVGSDTAGSVRIPAALSGCVGYKPVHGWIDLAGAFPLESDLDTAGVLARTVADARLAAAVLGDTAAAGSIPADPAGLAVGVITGELRSVLAPEVAAGLERALAALRRAGVRLVEVPIRHVEDRIHALFALIRRHATGVHGEAFRADPAAYGPDLATLLSMTPVTDTELAQARGVLAAAVAEVRGALGGCDALVSATVPIPAPLIGAMTVPLGGEVRPVENVLTRLTSIANATGWPAISVLAPSVELGDLPVGIQFQCAPGGVTRMLRVAALIAG